MNHTIIFGASQKLKQIKDSSIQLVVTSPPYPMIEMWDGIMGLQNKEVLKAIENGRGELAFQLMHGELDKVWAEIERVVIPGGIVCINIGDATRTLNGEFSLYSNHSRIISAFLKLGFVNLPNIIWRKQTNAPNKFMGSGMLPAGAYVTLEHEWILVFRKGGKRQFKNEDEKQLRRESGFFWEERNLWFSDLWELKGTKQKLISGITRDRSAAYPFEIPYRLINMYSLKGDTILDPFLGTGTTTLAAIASQRNSVGVEIDETFFDLIKQNILSTPAELYNSPIRNRLSNHENFIIERDCQPNKTEMKYFNKRLGMKVMTKQEVDISFSLIDNLVQNDGLSFKSTYKKIEAKKEIQSKILI